MKIKYASLLCTLLFISSSAQAVPSQHEEKGMFGTMGDFILDFWVGGYGCANLKQENEDFVRDIAYELRLKNPDKIYIRRLGQEEIRGGVWDVLSFWITFKDQTAMAYHMVGFARCIFIDEAAFEKLSVDEKRFVVGRELMRIKEDDAVKLCVISAGLLGMGGGVSRKFLVSVVFIPYIIRMFDKSADIESAQCLNACKGALMYYNMMSRYKRVCREDMRQWVLMKAYRKIRKFITCPFTTRHPFRKKKQYMREFCM